MPALIDMALDYPRLFLQMAYDAELIRAMRKSQNGKPQWRKPGEKAVDARDRLRKEREEAKRRLGVA